MSDTLFPVDDLFQLGDIEFLYTPPYDPATTGYVWNNVMEPAPAWGVITWIEPVLAITDQPAGPDYLAITRSIVGG